MARYNQFWYNSWRSMMARCYNEKTVNYQNYGGAGITVCVEWHNADVFGAWAKSSGWFKGATLDRIDNSKGYSPENCRWATKKEQAYNRKSTHFITYNGETHNITEWAEILGVKRTLLLNRLSRGWSEQDIFEPKYKNRYERRSKKCAT